MKGPPEGAVEGMNRAVVASVNLVVLLAFFVTQRIFAGIEQVPSWGVLGLMLAAVAVRVAEIVFTQRRGGELPVALERRMALLSVGWNLALALPLAIVSRESDTPYFGMLLLPILETAIYFSLPATVVVASTSSAISIFWVVFAGHFHPPFAVGEMLESATLVLMYFIVGTLVWLLMERIRRRGRMLRLHMADLERTRNRLIEQEKLAAIGRLASSVAHEIRNPVAIISSALEASGSEAFPPNEREEMNRVAMMESRRLEKLTTDFLSYANLGPTRFEPLDLGTLAGYVEGIVRVQATQKQLRLDMEAGCEDSCVVHGNEGQLQQVLLNLMRNAVDAAPEASTIRVRVQPEAPASARITIENAGPAIPEEAVGRIFEPFFTQKVGGTGLGLAIAKRIVEQHGGTLELERNATDCVMFAITLPTTPRCVEAAETTT